MCYSATYSEVKKNYQIYRTHIERSVEKSKKKKKTVQFFDLKANYFTYLISVVLAILDMGSDVYAFFPNSQTLKTKMFVKDIKTYK